MKNGLGIAAVAALGAAALWYVWRKYQLRAPTLRTTEHLLDTPLRVTGGPRPDSLVIDPPKVIYINPVRLQ